MHYPILHGCEFVDIIIFWHGCKFFRILPYFGMAVNFLGYYLILAWL